MKNSHKISLNSPQITFSRQQVHTRRDSRIGIEEIPLTSLAERLHGDMLHNVHPPRASVVEVTSYPDLTVLLLERCWKTIVTACGYSAAGFCRKMLCTTMTTFIKVRDTNLLQYTKLVTTQIHAVRNSKTPLRALVQK